MCIRDRPKPIAEPPKIAPQASQITDSMMQEGKNQARAWFEEMKAQKAREEQQRQAEEKKQRQQDKDQDLGMSL